MYPTKHLHYNTTTVTGFVARDDTHEFSTDHGNFTPKKATIIRVTSSGPNLIYKILFLQNRNNNYSNKVQMTDFIHGDGRTQVQWKALLSNEKSKILASRECEAIGYGAQSHIANGNAIYNTDAVKVVDREYLYKDFVAKKKEDRSHIDDI